MMFGHEARPTRVYSYGAKPPRGHDAALIRAQIDAGWRYRNDLVARELARREAAEAVVLRHYPALAELEALIEDTDRELAEIRDRVRRANAERRKKEVAAETRDRARQLRADLKGLRAEHRVMRRAAYREDDAVRAELADVDAHDLAERKRLRAESGLHWGSYLAIEQSLQGIRRGAPPRFIRRAEWGGAVTVQTQGNPSPADIMAGHGQCRLELEPLPPTAKPGGRRSRRPFARLSLRVGSEGPGNRSPIWATVRFVMHRPLPADASVKWVRLTRSVEGTAETWKVQFVVSRDSWAHQDTHEAVGVAALNLGWRSMSDGVRVAVVEGDDGSRDELLIPYARIAGLEKAASLESIRDREMNAAREALSHWLATAEVPEWLREATETLGRWRSPARLAALVLRWRSERFSGDEEIHARVEAWRAQDRHLCDWAAAERAKFRRWRRDTYRRFAARLRWRYETVIVESTDYRAFAMLPAAEEDEEAARESTRRVARAAAPGILREALESGHPQTVRVDPADASTTCSVCGADAHPDWDRISQPEFRCVAGHRLDQDRNNARNLLERYASGEVVAG